MQVKFGCDFGVDKDGVATDDATIWMDQYALWWNVEQHVSTPGTNDGNSDGDASILSWTGNVEGSASWGAAQPKPSAYTFVYSSAACMPDDSTGDAGQIGMRWGSPAVVIDVAEDQEAVKSKAEVLSWMEEQQLDMTEEWDVQFAAATEDIREAKKQAENSAMVSIIAAAVSAVLLLMVLATASFRVANPTGFRKVLLSDATIVRADDYDKGDNSL
jgi:hypothetical protein